MTIIPAPPGFAVALQKPIARRFAPPDPSQNFYIGFFDRGDVAQVNSPNGLTKAMGPRTNYSITRDDILAQMAEGSRTTTIARVTGPDAAAASLVLNDGAGTPAPSVKVVAGSVGQWGNGATGGLAAEVVLNDPDDEDDDRVKIIIYEGTTVVDATPAASTVAELAAYTSDTGNHIVALGSQLPAVKAKTNLTGGDDDRDSVTIDDYVAALAKLDKRYGPGVLRAGGIDDEDVQLAMIDHAEATGRLVFLDLDSDVTEAEAEARRASLRAARPDTCWRALLWGEWVTCTPITGEPDRLVPISALQAGVSSRVLREFGLSATSFGPRRGVYKTARRLHREWTTSVNPPGEIQRLYAAAVNAAVDRGQTICSEGFRTLDPDPRREDGHVAFILMYIAWRGEALALSQIGELVDADTLAAYHTDLEGLGNELRTARAINPRDPSGNLDGGWLVDVDGVNDADTMAARELHGAVLFRPTGSAHWVDLTVGSVAANERLG